MANLARAGNARPRPVMNVTPLVDVVLVLLIIFMIVIPAMDGGLNISEPGVLNPDDTQQSPVDPFLISITSDGAVYFEDRPLASDEVEPFLREAHAREPARRVVLRGDRALRYADARALFRMAQSIGFPGVSLRVNRVQTGEEP